MLTRLHLAGIKCISTRFHYDMHPYYSMKHIVCLLREFRVCFAISQQDSNSSCDDSPQINQSADMTISPKSLCQCFSDLLLNPVYIYLTIPVFHKSPALRLHAAPALQEEFQFLPSSCAGRFFVSAFPFPKEDRWL